jgi:hypothetical protein
LSPSRLVFDVEQDECEITRKDVLASTRLLACRGDVTADCASELVEAYAERALTATQLKFGGEGLGRHGS